MIFRFKFLKIWDFYCPLSVRLCRFYFRQQSDSASDAGRPSSSVSDRGTVQEQRSESTGSGAAQGGSVSTLSASSFMEKDSSTSIQSNDEHSYTEYMIVRDTLYASRENVNFVHEVFHQVMYRTFSVICWICRIWCYISSFYFCFSF